MWPVPGGEGKSSAGSVDDENAALLVAKPPRKPNEQRTPLCMQDASMPQKIERRRGPSQALALASALASLRAGSLRARCNLVKTTITCGGRWTKTF